MIVPEEEIPEDDGTPPSPDNVEMNDNNLTWGQVEGDVIGYRVYMSSSEEEEFRRIDSTKELSVKVPFRDRIYAVSAVDFYGNESELSDPVIFGKIEEPEEEENEEDKEQDEDNNNSNDDQNSEDENGNEQDNQDDNEENTGNDNNEDENNEDPLNLDSGDSE